MHSVRIIPLSAHADASVVYRFPNLPACVTCVPTRHESSTSVSVSQMRRMFVLGLRRRCYKHLLLIEVALSVSTTPLRLRGTLCWLA